MADVTLAAAANSPILYSGARCHPPGAARLHTSEPSETSQYPLQRHLCGLCALCAVLLHTADSFAPSITAAACSSGDRGNTAAPSLLPRLAVLPLSDHRPPGGWQRNALLPPPSASKCDRRSRAQNCLTGSAASPARGETSWLDDGSALLEPAWLLGHPRSRMDRPAVLHPGRR